MSPLAGLLYYGWRAQQLRSWKNLVSNEASHTTALPSLLLFFPLSPNPGVSVSHPSYSYSCSAAPLPINTIASLFCQLPSFLMWIMVLGLLDCRLVWLLSLFLLHLQNNELKIQTSRKPKELNLKCHCLDPFLAHQRLQDKIQIPKHSPNLSR